MSDDWRLEIAVRGHQVTGHRVIFLYDGGRELMIAD